MKCKISLAIFILCSLAFFSCNHIPLPEQFNIFKKNTDSDFQIETIERDKDNFEILKDTTISDNCSSGSSNMIGHVHAKRRHVNIIFTKQPSVVTQFESFDTELPDATINNINQHLKDNYTCTIEYIDTCLMGVNKASGKEIVKVRKQLIVLATAKPASES